jgi:hypothetical protein
MYLKCKNINIFNTNNKLTIPATNFLGCGVNFLRVIGDNIGDNWPDKVLPDVEVEGCGVVGTSPPPAASSN